MLQRTNKKILIIVFACIICVAVFGLYKYNGYQAGVKSIGEYSASFINVANSSLEEIDGLLNNESKNDIDKIEQSITALKSNCVVMEVLLNDIKSSAEKSNVKIFEHLYTNVIDGVKIGIVCLEDYDSNKDNIMIWVGLEMSQRETEESMSKLIQMLPET